jgi:FkbM family methyltransferase
MSSIRQAVLSHLSANQKDTLRRVLGRLALYQTPPEQIYLEQIVSTSPSTFLVQIGANDGDDFVRSVIRRYGRSHDIKAILVEPQPYFCTKLLNNYEKMDDIKIMNVAVSDSAKEATLYYIDYGAKGVPGWAKGLGSFDRDVVLSHEDLFTGLGQSIKTLNVKCVTVPELLADAPNGTMDVLVIDTEGHDYVILKQFDFTQVRPKLIVFESKHLPADDVARSDAMLCGAGYCVIHSGTDNSIAIRSDVSDLLTPEHAARAIPPKAVGVTRSAPHLSSRSAYREIAFSFVNL